MSSDALAALELPPSLQAVLDSLLLETCGVEAALRRHLQQTQSPLSLVRQDAYSGLAASLDGALRDPARAPAVLPALSRVWPQLLQSIAMGLRQAPVSRPASAATPASTPGGAPSPVRAGAAALSYRAIAPAELTSMVLVLQLACLLAPQARQASLAAGLLPLLLAQLPGAPPQLATACMDAMLAMQLRSPPAFLAFTEQGGVEQMCRLLRGGSSPEPVRGHAVQFLNLLLTQLAPELLPSDVMPPPTPSPAPGAFTTPDRHGTAGGATPGSVGGATPYSVGGATPAGATPGVQRPAPTEGRPEQAEAVLAALDAAKGVVAEVLGREARAMLLRRVSLADGAASSKLAQLANALNLFISPDGESDA